MTKTGTSLLSVLEVKGFGDVTKCDDVTGGEVTASGFYQCGDSVSICGLLARLGPS